MATEFRKLLVREGLESSAGNLDPREIGITTDTERPMFGTASGTKFGATEKIVEISVAAPPALDQVIDTVSEIACDTDAAGAGIALNILAGASKSPAILAISNRGATHSVTVTYRTATTFTIAPGYTAWVLWDDEGWTLLAADTARNATLLQGYTPGLDGTLPAGDAGKLSRWGWGVDTITVMTGSLDNYKTAGVFADPANLTNSAFPGVSIAVVTVKADTPSLVTQEAAAFSNTAANRRIVRRQYNTAIPGWSPWVEVFTSETDGNAGQPPAPKPTTGTPAGGANAPGQAYADLTITEGNTFYYSGSSNLTGTWEFTVVTWLNSNGAIDRIYTGSNLGSGFVFVVPAGMTSKVYTKRVL